MVVAVAFLLLKTWSPVTLTPPQAGILILLVQRSKLGPRAVTAVEGARRHLSPGPRLAASSQAPPSTPVPADRHALSANDHGGRPLQPP